MNGSDGRAVEGEVPHKVAFRGCALMLAGLVSMTVVAVANARVISTSSGLG